MRETGLLGPTFAHREGDRSPQTTALPRPPRDAGPLPVTSPLLDHLPPPDRHRRELDSNAARVPLLERRMADASQSVDDALARCQRLDDDNARLRSEIATLSQQLERSTMTLERERGRTAEHTEQIAYLTKRLGASHMAAGGPSQSHTSTMYWAIAAWLWLPVLHFFRGLFFVLHPLLMTFEHLAIFGGPKARRNAGLFAAYSDDDDDTVSSERAPSAAALRSSAGDIAGVSQSAAPPPPFSLLQQLRSGHLTPATATRPRR